MRYIRSTALIKLKETNRLRSQTKNRKSNIDDNRYYKGGFNKFNNN